MRNLIVVNSQSMNLETLHLNSEGRGRIRGLVGDIQENLPCNGNKIYLTLFDFFQSILGLDKPAVVTSTEPFARDSGVLLNNFLGGVVYQNEFLNGVNFDSGGVLEDGNLVPLARNYWWRKTGILVGGTNMALAFYDWLVGEGYLQKNDVSCSALPGCGFYLDFKSGKVFGLSYKK